MNATSLRRRHAAVLLLSLAGLSACGTAPATPDVATLDAAGDTPATSDAAPGDGATDADPPDAAPAAPPEVTLPQGTVRGRRGTGYQEFLGIPYAAPPVGDLRWRAPVPHAGWQGVREATTVPSRCPQSLLGMDSGAEDCLFVNVHVPDPRPANAPVMVWIHGGGFTLGEGVQLDSGTRGDVWAATRGVIVVSMNYRLGALGFLSHPGLTSEGTAGSGNYGLLDQRFAMQWVRDHIAAFGGDPNNVTLAGESAGGISVCTHLVSPLSAGLFQRAVVESGPCGLPPPSLAANEAQGVRFATALGCTDPATAVACMRAAQLPRVMAALPLAPEIISADPMFASWTPVVDGAFLPEAPMARLRAGTFNRVPLLYGWNHDEGTLFVSLANLTGLTAAQYPATILAMVGGNAAVAERVLARYPLKSYAAPFDAYATALGDYKLACPARRALLAMAPHVPQAWAYEFAYPNASFQLMPAARLGAFHSAEVQFVFGHPAQIGRTRFVGAELALHQTMLGYWSRFVAASNPNGADAVAWPAFTVDGDANLRIDLTSAAGARFGAEACTFWEAQGLYE